MYIKCIEANDAELLEWIITAYRKGCSMGVIAGMLADLSVAFGASGRYCRIETHAPNSEIKACLSG
jgi:hypothetical protein